MGVPHGEGHARGPPPASFVLTPDDIDIGIDTRCLAGRFDREKSVGTESLNWPVHRTMTTSHVH